MPRRLSNVEWVTFLQEVNVPALGLPPWGGVVEWRGMDILVYIGPSGEVFTTDVTGDQITQNVARVYDARAETWYYHLPEEVIQQAADVAIRTGQVTQSSIEEVARVVGSAAGTLTQPILSNLSLPLVVLGIVGMIYLAKR
jgi:hypothetical protein